MSHGDTEPESELGESIGECAQCRHHYFQSEMIDGLCELCQPEHVSEVEPGYEDRHGDEDELDWEDLKRHEPPQVEDTFVRRLPEPKRLLSELDSMEMGGWDPEDGFPRTASDFPKRGER